MPSSMPFDRRLPMKATRLSSPVTRALRVVVSNKAAVSVSASWKRAALAPTS